MTSIKLKAFAKLNLSLDVTGVREDGYHLMDMINRSVSLGDTLSIRKTPGRNFSIRTDLDYIPTDERNLIWKAASVACETIGTELPQVSIKLEKVIPTQAGLGGGSADAAATLIGLNLLLDWNLTDDELRSIGLKVGADVPFCITGGCARTTGIGEILMPFNDACRYDLVIVMPRKGHSTGEFFKMLDSGKEFIHPDSDLVQSFLEDGDLSSAMDKAGNIFEQAVPDEVTGRIEKRLLSLGALHASMTGTGAAVFGIFTSREKATEACASMRKERYSAWRVHPVSDGVDILEEHL